MVSSANEKKKKAGNGIQVRTSTISQTLHSKKLSLSGGKPILHYIHIETVMAEFFKKCCTCLWCSEVACCAACCVDTWWGTEAEGLALLSCGNCCWKSCAPICFSCTCGDVGGGMKDCVTGLKYCVFSCGACLVAPVDGCYACGFAIVDSCG